MNRINWAVVVAFVCVVLLVFIVGVSLVGGWGHGGWGMMGPGMMGRLGYFPVGWIGMIFMWLIPVSFISLIVVGVGWVIRSIDNGSHPIVSWQNCSTCRRSIQTEWHNCPYCGTLQVK